MVKGPKVVDDGYLNVFSTKVLSNADALYRFAFSVCLDRDTAFDSVRSVVEGVLTQMASIDAQSEDEVKLQMFKDCWTDVSKRDVAPNNSGLSPQLSRLSNVTTKQRAAVILTDAIGFQMDETAAILSEKLKELTSQLVEARKALVSN